MSYKRFRSLGDDLTCNPGEEFDLTSLQCVTAGQAVTPVPQPSGPIAVPLPKPSTPAPVTPAKETDVAGDFFAKYKPWIIGGGAALLGIVVLAAVGGGGSRSATPNRAKLTHRQKSGVRRSRAERSRLMAQVVREMEEDKAVRAKRAARTMEQIRAHLAKEKGASR